jgi:hypothetical protein
VVGFAVPGLWRYANGAWSQLHTFGPGGLSDRPVALRFSTGGGVLRLRSSGFRRAGRAGTSPLRYFWLGLPALSASERSGQRARGWQSRLPGTVASFSPTAPSSAARCRSSRPSRNIHAPKSLSRTLIEGDWSVEPVAELRGLAGRRGGRSTVVSRRQTRFVRSHSSNRDSTRPRGPRGDAHPSGACREESQP